MEIKYNWECKNVAVTKYDGKNIHSIHEVNWALVGKSGKSTGFAIGVEKLNTSKIKKFRKFNSITHKQIIEWVINSMGEEKVEEIKADITDQIKNQEQTDTYPLTIGETPPNVTIKKTKKKKLTKKKKA
tara:strand:- start:2948 stop:3334 length:387 start_codon:yes stop_codon:yes gene_type:complete